MASHQEGELQEHLAEPQPRGHSTLGLQCREAAVGDTRSEKVGPLDDVIEGEDIRQTLDNVAGVYQVGLPDGEVPSRECVPSKLQLSGLQEEIQCFCCC